MNGLDDMKMRLNYAGGAPQQSRMIADKLRSLKKALLYSYQAGTMVVDNPYEDYDVDSLEFRCLMNPDKLTFDADLKMLSVPFKDVCLNLPRKGKTSEGIIQVPISCGDTFTWKETNSRWLVTLRYLEELAYFRADVRKCFPYPLEIEGETYWFASVGENEKTIEWLRKNKQVINHLNYTRALYIKRDENTLNYFKRFKIVELPDIDGTLHPWQVQAVSPNSIDDVLVVALKEYYTNQFEEISEQEQAKIKEEHELNEDLVVTVYDNFSLSASFVDGAVWEIRNKTEYLKLNIDAELVKENSSTIATIQLFGKTGEFDVYYNDEKIKHVVVKSL